MVYILAGVIVYLGLQLGLHLAPHDGELSKEGALWKNRYEYLKERFDTHPEELKDHWYLKLTCLDVVDQIGDENLEDLSDDQLRLLLSRCIENNFKQIPQERREEIVDRYYHKDYVKPSLGSIAGGIWPELCNIDNHGSISSRLIRAQELHDVKMGMKKELKQFLQSMQSGDDTSK